MPLPVDQANDASPRFQTRSIDDETGENTGETTGATGTTATAPRGDQDLPPNLLLRAGFVFDGDRMIGFSAPRWLYERNGPLGEQNGASEMEDGEDSEQEGTGGLPAVRREVEREFEAGIRSRPALNTVHATPVPASPPLPPTIPSASRLRSPPFDESQFAPPIITPSDPSPPVAIVPRESRPALRTPPRLGDLLRLGPFRSSATASRGTPGENSTAPGDSDRWARVERARVSQATTEGDGSQASRVMSARERSTEELILGVRDAMIDAIGYAERLSQVPQTLREMDRDHGSYETNLANLRTAAAGVDQILAEFSSPTLSSEASRSSFHTTEPLSARIAESRRRLTDLQRGIRAEGTSVETETRRYQNPSTYHPFATFTATGGISINDFDTRPAVRNAAAEARALSEIGSQAWSDFPPSWPERQIDVGGGGGGETERRHINLSYLRLDRNGDPIAAEQERGGEGTKDSVAAFTIGR